MKAKTGILVLIVILNFISFSSLQACTIGIANKCVTKDKRPLFWKVGDTSDTTQQIIYVSGFPYDYIGVRSEGRPIFTGLNQAGIASGNSLVPTPGGTAVNSAPQRHILENFDSLGQIRNYIQEQVDLNDCNASGCFPFIDANENALIFEINRSNWWLEYDSVDPDRQLQNLFGFVVRANEFHQHSDGTDDTNITGGRYESGTYNVSGLVDINELSAMTLIQGNNGSSDFEFARYGPGRPLATIARSTNVQVTVVHGVAKDEDPALTTMWVILGQANYGIAVPLWVKVCDIPPCLHDGDMYARARSLYNKSNESITQASTFPMEAHLFEVVNNTFLQHWRTYGVPSRAEMTRIEQRTASDAYSLLDCLDNYQNDNKAPDVSFNALPDGLTLSFEVIADDSDGTIESIEWDFGDDQISTQVSPSHTYTEPRTYLISCTVTDDDGVSITDWRYYAVPVNCDVAGDQMVDFTDLAQLSAYWLETNCGEPDWCEGADFDRNSTVNLADFTIFAEHWLEEARP